MVRKFSTYRLAVLRRCKPGCEHQTGRSQLRGRETALTHANKYTEHPSFVEMWHKECNNILIKIQDVST